MASNTGKISQIIGPVVDVVFEGKENTLPRIYDSLGSRLPPGTFVLKGSITRKTLFAQYQWILQMTQPMVLIWPRRGINSNAHW